MEIQEIFESVSDEMQSKFLKAKSALDHSGLKGESNEAIVRTFLRQYLPASLEISTGTIVDSDGNSSRQIDIIIHDSSQTPIFYQSRDIKVVPIECVYAVIEVKANLVKAELEKSFHNMRSVKQLKKKAFFPSNSVIVQETTLYGRGWKYWPVQHYVFAFDSPDLNSVLPNLNDIQASCPVHERIDSICILGKGVILNRSSDGMFWAAPDPTSECVASHTQKPLLFFYTLISMLLNQATMRPFNLHPYLSKISF